jgi:hypothetical protein
MFKTVIIQLKNNIKELIEEKNKLIDRRKSSIRAFKVTRNKS